MQTNEIIETNDSQRLIYPYESIESDSIQSLEKIEEISYIDGSELVSVLIKSRYIMKKVNISHPSPEIIQQLQDEFEIKYSLHHQNIQNAFKTFINDNKLPPSILLEYCRFNLIKAVKSKMFSKAQQTFSIYQIAEGMKYIHSQRVVHQN